MYLLLILQCGQFQIPRINDCGRQKRRIFQFLKGQIAAKPFQPTQDRRKNLLASLQAFSTKIKPLPGNDSSYTLCIMTTIGGKCHLNTSKMSMKRRMDQFQNDISPFEAQSLSVDRINAYVFKHKFMNNKKPQGHTQYSWLSISNRGDQIAFQTSAGNSQFIIKQRQLPINCINSSNINLIRWLVASLANHPDIDFTAYLKEPLILLHVTNRHPSEVLICYSLTFLNDLDEAIFQREVDHFEYITNFVHEKIQQYNQKYSLENRIGYWVGKLHDQIKKVMKSSCLEKKVDEHIGQYQQGFDMEADKIFRNQL